jgi:hypothetical protein
MHNEEFYNLHSSFLAFTVYVLCPVPIQKYF